MDTEGVRLVTRHGVPHDEWPWKDTKDARVAQVPIGLAHHTGVVLVLADGSCKDVLLPGRSTFSYPPALAKIATVELRRRLAAHQMARNLRLRASES
jgi:hypothetical protein